MTRQSQTVSDQTAAPAASQARTSPFLLCLTLVTLMLPISFNLGTILMSPSRLLFLIVTPFLLIGLLSGRYGKLTLVDGLFLAFVAWRSMTPFINATRNAVEYSGSNMLVILGGYLVARATVRSVPDMLFAGRILILFALVTFPLALYESLTTQMVLPKYLEMIPGVHSVTDVNYDKRMGLDRAQVVFPHPILYGLFCSICFSLAFIALRNHATTVGRWIKSAFIFGCCFLSVSSGPLLSVMAQIGLTGWSILFARYDKRWKVLLWITAVFYVIAEIASNRPAIYAIVSRLSFSAATANARRIQFEYGVAAIKRNPLFGVGQKNWGLPQWMTGSLDNYWLALGLQFGLPTLICCGAAFIIGMVKVGKRDFQPGSDLWNLQLTWVVTMVSLSLTLATVYIWNEVASLVFFFFGAGQFLIFATEQSARATSAPVTRGLTYTRFRRTEAARPAPAPAQKPATSRRPATAPGFDGEFR